MGQIELMLQDNLFFDLSILLKIDSVKYYSSSFKCYYHIAWSCLLLTTVVGHGFNVVAFEIFEHFCLAVPVIEVVVISSFSDDEAVPSFLVEVDIFDAWCFLSGWKESQKGFSLDLR